ncbi:unnamed protein product [Tilletia laevis]|nr:unnamed protein product [Tilletia caries]CAD6946700.1 unnamed protein product [Tilletia laevis]
MAISASTARKNPVRGSIHAPILVSSSVPPSQGSQSPQASPLLGQDFDLTDASCSRVTQQVRKAPRPWTLDQETELVKLIKDNLRYQTAFLPGHSLVQDPRESKVSGATMLRAISSAIFPSGLAKTADQVRQKITGIIKKYHDELRSMSVTGQGLLLEEMRDGPVKNAREDLLTRCPWWDDLHEMMRDRGSSEPEELVTGAGEIYSHEGSTQGTPIIGAADDHRMDDIEQHVFLPRAGTRKRPSSLDFDLEDDDMNSVSDLDQLISSSQDSSAGSGQLSGQSSRDPMNKDAIGSGTPSGSNASPPKMRDTGKTPIRGEGPPKPKTEGRTPRPNARSGHVDDALDDYARHLQEQRELRVQATIEREQTKRLKLELKSQLREREADSAERRLRNIEERLNTITNMISQHCLSSTEASHTIKDNLIKITTLLDKVNHDKAA